MNPTFLLALSLFLSGAASANDPVDLIYRATCQNEIAEDISEHEKAELKELAQGLQKFFREPAAMASELKQAEGGSFVFFALCGATIEIEKLAAVKGCAGAAGEKLNSKAAASFCRRSMPK